MLTANHHQVAHKAQVRDRPGLVECHIDVLLKNGSFEQFTDGNREADPENREDRMDDQSGEPLDEHTLSQQMSHLSTSRQPTISSTNVKDDIEAIPNYLSKKNKSFKDVIYRASSSSSLLKNKMKGLRRMVILMYKIMLIQIYHTLWSTYLKSGTGILKAKELPGVKVWPTEVKSLVMKQKANEDEACLACVNHYLRHLDDRMEHYRDELNRINGQLCVNTQTIETFVQQGLEARRLEMEHKVTLVHHDYNDRVLESEYLQQKPSKHQKQIARRLCQAKYKQETSKQEYNLLKTRISNYDRSKASGSHNELFDSIDDPTAREQQFYNRYRQVIQKSNDEMISLYLSSAEAQMQYYQKHFNDELKRIWEEQRTARITEKLTVAMLHLIEQRYNNISDRVKCVYDFRVHLLDLNLSI
ncbi:unnamed protein product [Didymodactylos carnosus]|uniref:Uncharacterized protein n=1 Tax=Didymodactylos carnosus TaxID=1234261 RepID=A0A814MWD2_9BILA|nr:unnamed protein product [Didymodactylos carnosus]CAF3849338.1 unnamed protein product [Didymodactylos carnosus]